MKSFSFLAISFATPILGGPLPQLIPRADDRNWRDIPCDYGSLSDARNDPFDQWNDAKASEAFSDAYNQYMKDNDQYLGFSNSIANYFHTVPGINCGTLGATSGCNQPLVCGQGAQENAYVASPAG